MARQQVRYAELTVTPYSSVTRGIPAEAFCEAIEDARRAAERDFGIVLRWCFDIPGEAGPGGGRGDRRPSRWSSAPEGLVRFGLGGPEIGVPRPQFKPYFDQARAAGLHSVPHAGETTGPETIWDACATWAPSGSATAPAPPQDPELLAYLAEHRIPLEVCPTSNIATRAVADPRRAPDPGDGRGRRAWSPSTATTRRCSAPTSNTEYAVAARLLDLDAAGVAALARNAVEASFLDEPAKAKLTAEIDAYANSFTPSL